MDVDNPRGRLKPAMLATMTLRETPAAKRVVPITAIVREENREYVFVESAPQKLVMREVTLGDEFENRRVLMEGIAPREKLVLDGAFHINNERKRLALQKGSL
jgi:cobalt-zinc-cadmium efflux system membrane fusion protein